MTCDISLHKKRRARFAEKVGDGIALIPTAREHPRNPCPYRPDSYFWYLTGFPEPEAVLVIAAGRSLLFCREKDPERETWTGVRYGPEAAREIFAFDETWPLSELEKKLPELIANRPVLWHALGMDGEWDARVMRALESVRGMARAGQSAPALLSDWRDTLDGMRLLKDESELAHMRRAAEITASGHLGALQSCAPGMAEYALEAELSYQFRRLGANGHAYNPIVASGGNACILHYTRNDRTLQDGELVLIDAGCEYQGYAADITRTFPVNGRFSAAQKDCYEIVLAAQQAAIAAARPGAPFNAPHMAAVRVLTQGMVDLGLLSGNIDHLIETTAYQRFYMHRTGHWLGLDVHDAGRYRLAGTDDREDWVALAPGMTLTCEPGLYIPAAPDIPAALADIGIRIEDDLLVTARGCEVYTQVPKSVAEIEEAMRGGREAP
ncbi:MAG: aminopeptidase P N-terminal domain-containing protein [Zoogloeaceae bacterium]|jgi:Xaa-Pro aminopeptidase|nr:aminopeptidase P N-terminal domain-containing protein [Zoogloeaceae bacterium]